MTLKIKLAPTVESGLSVQAKEQGLSLPAYAEQVLEERSAAAPPKPQRTTLLELFEPLRGLDITFTRNHSTGRSEQS